MASSIGRSLVIGLSADTKNFGKNLSKAEKDLAKFKSGVKKIGMAVTAGFAAMGAAALAFGKDAVQSAMEDQQEQIKLRRTIHANVKAHKDMAKAVEKSVTAMQKQYGVSDNKLRKGFGKLIIATKNVSKSQKLMRTAMNVSAATGKDLETVTTAISKAYLGNNTALGRLGLGFSKAQLKGLSFSKILDLINQKTAGQGAAAANTFAGKVGKLTERWGEFKENIGYKLMPILMQLMDYIEKKVMPNIESFAGAFTGDKGLNKAMKDGTEGAYNLGVKVKDTIGWIIKHKDGLEKFGKVLLGLWAIGKVTAWTSTVVGAISALVKSYKGLTIAANTAAAAESRALGGGIFGKLGKLRGLFSLPAIGAYAGYQESRMLDRDFSNPGRVLGLSILSKYQSMSMVPRRTEAQRKQYAALGQVVNQITINGAIDPNATAKSIAKVLQQYGLNTKTLQLTGRVSP